MSRDVVVAYFDAQAQGYQRSSTSWPWSWLRAREQEAVLMLLGDLAGKTILELGAGSGYYSRLFLANGCTNVVAVDIAPKMVSAQPQEISSLQGDAASIKLERKFQIIACLGLLEFVADCEAILRNAAEHVDDGGHLLLMVPRHCLAGIIYRFFHHTHNVDVRLFSDKELQEIAMQTGWRMEYSIHVPIFSLVASFRRAL